FRLISGLENTITFSENQLTKMAEQCGFLTRYRTILPHALVLSTLTALGKDSNAESLADLHRKLNEMTGLHVSYHAWREQVSKPEFVILMVWLFLRSLDKMVKRTLSFDPSSPFARFRHVWLHDGSSQAVIAKLKETLPGRFKTVSPAAVELHTTMDLLTDNIVRVSLTEDTRSERDCLPALISDLSDTLMMIDAGYFDLEYFMASQDREGCFLCRAPQSINPLVHKVIRSDGQNCHRYEGQKLKDVLPHFPKDGCMDLDVEWSQAKGYMFRVVVRWNGQKKKWVFVVTNLSRESFSLQDIFLAYRLRWQIELAFKETKSYARWHRFNTACVTLVTSLIFASFIVVVLKRPLAHAVERSMDSEISTRKTAMTGTHLFGELMLGLLRKSKHHTLRALKILCKFWQENGKREHPARDKRTGRSALGLGAIGCA
ncbi:IS4 family transposase, partial [Sansalvadorimonas verongulae]|uniref:IS4 family transposase n=1 Tax=Sansalvadorimonas verongulae TaxID=2172824 RepID=UPI001E313164